MHEVFPNYDALCLRENNELYLFILHAYRTLHMRKSVFEYSKRKSVLEYSKNSVFVFYAEGDMNFGWSILRVTV